MNIVICETEDDLWFESVRVWDEIAIETLNHLIDQFHDHLRTIAALDGRSRNGHHRVEVLVISGHTTQEIRGMIEQEQETLTKFIDESDHFFHDESWETSTLKDRIHISRNIVLKLLESIQVKAGLMTPNGFPDDLPDELPEDVELQT
jgi:hypothetical protein